MVQYGTNNLEISREATRDIRYIVLVLCASWPGWPAGCRHTPTVFRVVHYLIAGVNFYLPLRRRTYGKTSAVRCSTGTRYRYPILVHADLLACMLTKQEPGDDFAPLLYLHRHAAGGAKTFRAFCTHLIDTSVHRFHSHN